MHRSFEQNFYLHTTVYLVWIWTNKNAEKKSAYFFKKKQKRKKRKKNGYCVNLSLVSQCASPQLRTNKKSCGLADFASLNCGLRLIFVRNSACLIEALKFLSIIVKCLLPNITIQFNFFQFKFGKNTKFFEFRPTKILSLLFDLIAFFLLTCCFFRVRRNNQLSSSFKFKSAALVQSLPMALLFFSTEFTKLATWRRRRS